MNIKQFTLLLALFFPTLLSAQKPAMPENAYTGKVVPINENGFVVFEKDIKIERKTKNELFIDLQAYLQNQLLRHEYTQRDSKLVENDEAEGLLAVRMDEYLYFKKTPFETDRVHFLYNLIANIEDGKVKLTLQNLRYLYDPEASPYATAEEMPAEQWITDKEALNKKGKLIKKFKRFRIFTVDRVNSLFKEIEKVLK